MATNVTTTYITNMFQNTNVLGMDWVITLMVIVISMAIVTRQISKWKVLFFPMALGYYIIGLPVSVIFFIIGAMIMVTEAVSLEQIGSMIQNGVEGVIEGRQSIERYMQKRRKTTAEQWTKSGMGGLFATKSGKYGAVGPDYKAHLQDDVRENWTESLLRNMGKRGGNKDVNFKLDQIKFKEQIERDRKTRKKARKEEQKEYNRILKVNIKAREKERRKYQRDSNKDKERAEKKRAKIFDNLSRETKITQGLMQANIDNVRLKLREGIISLPEAEAQIAMLKDKFMKTMKRLK